MEELLEERYEVREGGIYFVMVTESGEIENLMLPREIFVEAFMKYCRGSESGCCKICNNCRG